MNELAGILAITGTALLSGSTIALRLDKTFRAQDADPLPDCEQGPTTEPSWWHTAFTGAPMGPWPQPQGVETQMAAASYSDGQRLTRNAVLPGNRLVSAKRSPITPVPKAPKLTASDMRRIRRRIRRDTRAPRTPATKMLRLAGIAALLFTLVSGAHKILGPATDTQNGNLTPSSPPPPSVWRPAG